MRFLSTKILEFYYKTILGIVISQEGRYVWFFTKIKLKIKTIWIKKKKDNNFLFSACLIKVCENIKKKSTHSNKTLKINLTKIKPPLVSPSKKLLQFGCVNQLKSKTDTRANVFRK